MPRGRDTRDHIIHSAAPVFNRKGFFGASMTDIMQATGLQKGGIYNHFDSKEELALLAFDHACALVFARFDEAVSSSPSPMAQLFALVRVFSGFAASPPLGGGCPLLNTATESDDAHPPLRARARVAMARLLEQVRGCAAAAIEAGEMRPEVDAAALATQFVATLEGGIMLGRLYRDAVYVERTVDFMCGHIAGLAT